MWQRDFNNTQTNKQLVGRGHCDAGWVTASPPHAAQTEVTEVGGTGEYKSDLWGWHAQDFWEYIKEQRCSKRSSGLVVTLGQVGQMAVVCLHRSRAGKEDGLRNLWFTVFWGQHFLSSQRPLKIDPLHCRELTGVVVSWMLQARLSEDVLETWMKGETVCQKASGLKCDRVDDLLLQGIKPTFAGAQKDISR